MVSYKGSEKFLDRWLLDVPARRVLSSCNEFDRVSNLIQVKGLTLAAKFPVNGIAKTVFLNSGSHYRNCEHHKIFTTRLMYFYNYLNNLTSVPNIDYFSFPFYPFVEQNIDLSDLSVLDYNSNTEDALFKQKNKHYNLYLFNKPINSRKSEAFIGRVDKSITFLDDLKDF